MNLGWCDVCLRVSKAAASREFYGSLGFYKVEGDDQEGWAVVTNGTLRLGLFEAQFMSDAISLNFRGGNISAICDELRGKGIAFSKEPKLIEGGGSASIRDPDGYSIFFDTAPGETMSQEPCSNEST